MNGSDIRIRDSFGCAQFEQSRLSRAYDTLARLPLVVWFTLCGVASTRGMITEVRAASVFGMTETLKLLAGLAGLGFILLVIGALCLRLPPLMRTAGLRP